VGFPEITETADGRSAVYLAEKLHPDLIVLDINLPDINGIDAAKKIRQVSPSSRIIFASLDNDADIRAAALEADPQAYVLKMNAGRELPKDIRAALDAI